VQLLLLLPCEAQKRQNAWHVKYWEIIIEISATLDGIAALWRLRMAKADQFGLWPQSERTLDALLCMQIKSCLPFSNSNPQFKPTDIIKSAIAWNRMKNWEIVADNLSKAGWSWGCVSAITSNGQTIWIDRREQHRPFQAAS
jgi:hypothetical protein